MTLISISDIQIEIGEDTYIFDPKDDMTPVESSRLTQMLVVASAHYRAFYTPDFGSFLTEHKLRRHFKLVENDNDRSKN